MRDSQRRLKDKPQDGQLLMPVLSRDHTLSANMIIFGARTGGASIESSSANDKVAVLSLVRIHAMLTRPS